MRGVMLTIVLIIIATPLIAIGPPSTTHYGIQEKAFQTPQKNLTRVFFGFYPYWIGTDDSFIHWNRISHIAWFSVDLNSDGSVANYNNWPSEWQNLVNDAHNNNTKLVVTFTLFGSTSIHNLISSETNRSRAISNIINAVKSGDADGVNIDFETPSSGDGQNLTAFLRELRSNADWNSSWLLTIDLSPYPWSSQVWSDPNLFPIMNEYVDYYFLMGYDYHWSGSSNTGACGALFSPSGIDAYHAILKYISYGANRSKFIYGVPYYGYDWPVSSSSYDQPGASTTGSGSARTYDSAMSILNSYGATLQWNSSYKTPWFWYYDSSDSEYRQVWFDNFTSISFKYELVNELDLAGAGVWALGYDKSTTLLWDAISLKLGNFSLDVKFPVNGSIIGGRINGTVITWGGVHELEYRVDNGSWIPARYATNLHNDYFYMLGVKYEGYVQAWNFYIDTNSYLPGNITVEFKANNSLGFVKTWNFSYYVRRDVALNGTAYGSSDAHNMIDDEDYVNYYSGFASNDLGKPLFIALPRNYTIWGFHIHLWDGDGRYYQYKISVSTDNITWREVVNRTTGEWRSWQWIPFTDLKARYIEINVTYNSANQWYHIIEFKIYARDDPVLAGFILCNGEPVPNATVTLKNTRTGDEITTKTDYRGYYEISLTLINVSQNDVINITASNATCFGQTTLKVNLLNPAPRKDVYVTPTVMEFGNLGAIIPLLLLISFIAIRQRWRKINA